MDNFSCDRCGKCCFEYNAKGYQIHFHPNDNFFSLTREEQCMLHPLVALYLRVKNEYIEKNGAQSRYLIPTKQQMQAHLREKEKEIIPLSENNGDECMFLGWTENNLAICYIHKYNPQMCRDYPSNKGGACLNHYERRFTAQFLNFQHQQIGFVIKILRELHRNKINDPIAWEIITFLMDFGRFPLHKVRNFFIVYFHISSERFDRLIHLLAEFTLISIIDDTFIEGISLREVEKIVDKMMDELGWTLPSAEGKN